MSKLGFASGFLVLLILLSFDIGDMGTPDFDQTGFILNISLTVAFTMLLLYQKWKEKKGVNS